MSRSKRKDELPIGERHEQLMQRIVRRYEQLDEELTELESKLPQLDDDDQSSTRQPARKRKPR